MGALVATRESVYANVGALQCPLAKTETAWKDGLDPTGEAIGGVAKRPQDTGWSKRKKLSDSSLGLINVFS